MTPTTTAAALPLEAEEHLTWLAAERGRSANTLAAYRRDLKQYVAWLADPPAWAVDELGALDGVSVAIEPGPDWEMVTFNQVNSLLAETWARTAIATAIDREAILDATVRAVDPDAVILDSTMWQEDGGPYPHRHDQAAARRILEDNGCALGSDGFYECGGRRMSFVWATTAGDPWRPTARR